MTTIEGKSNRLSIEIDQLIEKLYLDLRPGLNTNIGIIRNSHFSNTYSVELMNI